MKNVILTGGVGGIGSAILDVFIKKGFFVSAIDVDDKRGKAFTELYGEKKFRYYHADVTDIASVRKVAEEFKAVNHIVTLAGRALSGEWNGFSEMNVKDVQGSVDLNLFGHLNVIHAFVPALKNSDGEKSVTVISSINNAGGFGLPVYSAAKAGLIGFVKSVASEFGIDGIRINAVSPGTVPTEMTLKEPKDFTGLLKTTALNKFVSKEDVASLVYALSEEFVTVTGQEFIIDAGQTVIH